MSNCRLHRCFSYRATFDQTTWGSTRLDGCRFHRCYFSRLNDMYQTRVRDSSWSNCTGNLKWEHATVSASRWTNCHWSRFESVSSIWKHCQWIDTNHIDELLVDDQSRFDATCDFKGLVVQQLVQTPWRQQCRLVYLGAQIENGLHPTVQYAQSMRNRFRRQASSKTISL